MLSEHNHTSIFGGDANCVHHWKSRRYLSVRWYRKNAVPVDQENHNILHSSDKRCKELEAKIIEVNGQEWDDELTRRRYKVVKYLEFEKVRDHILGFRKDYI